MTPALRVTRGGTYGVDAIHATAQSIKAARQTLVISSGGGAGPAHILSYLGTIAGQDVQIALGSSPGQSVHGARLKPGDCLITINIWRLTRTLRALTRLARERGTTVSVLTDLRSSPPSERSLIARRFRQADEFEQGCSLRRRSPSAP